MAIKIRLPPDDKKMAIPPDNNDGVHEYYTNTPMKLVIKRAKTL
ncbi:MAG: hypothetical protein WAO23_00255 [Dethiobacteria bacterium]